MEVRLENHTIQFFFINNKTYPVSFTKLLYGSINGGLVNTLAAEGLKGLSETKEGRRNTF